MKTPQRVPDSKPIDAEWRKEDKDKIAIAPVVEADIAAAFLVETMGEDVAAAFFARFGAIMAEACHRAETLAHMRRAEDEPETELPVNQVRLSEALRVSPLPNDQLRIQAVASKIEREEELAPIVVRLRSKACCSSQPYELISGWDEFKAFVDVLGRTTVPVKIVPPVPLETLSIFDSSDA
jgi:hypothetical protein